MTELKQNAQRLLASCLRTLPDSFMGVQFSPYPSGASFIGMVDVPPYRVPELKELLVRETDAEQRFKLWSELGVEHRNWGEYSEAVDAYHQALQIYPSATRPFYGIAECLIRLERHHHAVKVLSVGLNVLDHLAHDAYEPLLHLPLAQRGWRPLDLDRLERKLPNRSDFLELLCDAREKIGDYAKALECARQLCGLDHAKDSYYAWAARLQIMCGGESVLSIANERALRLLAAFEPPSGTSTANLASELARLYEIFGIEKHATDIYRSLLKSLENFMLAEDEEWGEVRQRMAEQRSADYLMGWLYDRLGRHQEAINCFSSVLADSSETRLQVLQANAKVHGGDIDGALNIYLDCLEEPDNQELLNNLGVAHFLAGNHSDALSAFETAKKKASEHPVINFNYAVVALALSDRKFAEEQVRSLQANDAALADRLHLLLESHAPNLQIDLVPSPPLEVSDVQ